VQDLLRHPEVRGYTYDDICVIVRESHSKDKPRFEIVLESQTPGEPHIPLIRATHKHTRVNTVVQRMKRPPPLMPPPASHIFEFEVKIPSPVLKTRSDQQAPPLPQASALKAHPDEHPPPLPLSQTPELNVQNPLLVVDSPPSCNTEGGIDEVESFPSGCLTPKRTVGSLANDGCLTPQKVSYNMIDKLAECFERKPCAETYDEVGEAATGGDEDLPKWEKFQSEKGKEWWWNEEAAKYAFFVNWPGDWKQYEEPYTKRIFWYRDDKNWFFIDSGKKD